MFGENQLTNPFFGIIYVWLWVGVMFASLLFGPVWRAISPMRTINAGLARISGGDPGQGVLEYPTWLGHWPAAIGLYSFVWMELVNRTPTDLGTVRLWCAIYVAVLLVGGAVFGSRFYENADPFEVYSTLVGSLSIFGRDDEGTSRCAALWRARPSSRPVPDWSPWWPCCSGVRRSTPSVSRPIGSARSRRRRSPATRSTTWRC